MGSEGEIDAAVIGPMCALFPTPTHLRGNNDAIRQALNVYRRALGRFDPDVLAEAWQRVAERNTFWTWPKVADVVQACEEVRRRKPEEPWVEKATALSDAYVKRFMQTSQAAVRAREGGYERQLKEYVREAAWVQSQYVVGRSGVG